MAIRRPTAASSAHGDIAGAGAARSATRMSFSPVAEELPLLATAMLSICAPAGALTVTVMRIGVLIWPGASIEL